MTVLRSHAGWGQALTRAVSPDLRLWAGDAAAGAALAVFLASLFLVF